MFLTKLTRRIGCFKGRNSSSLLDDMMLLHAGSLVKCTCHDWAIGCVASSFSLNPMIEIVLVRFMQGCHDDAEILEKDTIVNYNYEINKNQDETPVVYQNSRRS